MANGRRGPIAILAGAGRLPMALAERLDREGRGCRILAFRGFAAPSLRGRADAVVDLLDVERTFACLDDWRPAGVVLAGAVTRPGPSAALSAFKAFRNRRLLDQILRHGDDHVLRTVLDLIEGRGHAVIGIPDVAPDLLGRPGVLTRAAPDEDAQRAIALARRLLVGLSPYDIGQAAVVRGDRVLAIEGPEGTDAMLIRVRGSRWMRPGRLRNGAAGVLVKLAKAGQDLRVDLPTIGSRTVVRAYRAGLSGIAYEAGRALVIDEAETAAAADRHGLFVLGIDGAQVVEP